MFHRTSINLGNLLLSLADAVDRAAPRLAGHQLRVAYVAWRVAEVLELRETETERIFAAALLHDVGALSPEERDALHRGAVDDLDAHCRRGEMLLRGVPALRASAALVRHHHTPWSAWRDPIERPVVLGSQVVLLADAVDRLLDRETYVLHQAPRVEAAVRAMAGREIHPEVAGALRRLAREPAFWFDLDSPRLYALLLHRGPWRTAEIELPDLLPVAAMARRIVDYRSAFTAGHSAGVAAAAVEIARIFGLTRAECRLVEIAGDLHDLGKLAIPSRVLDKPGPLDAEEEALFARHAWATHLVLDSVAGLEPVVGWAAYHHERLDGSGGPFGLTAEDLDAGARILAVADVFTALAEDRPYRKGLGRAGVAAVLSEEAARGALDARLVQLVLDAGDRIEAVVREQQARAREEYRRVFAPSPRPALRVGA